MAVTGPFRVGDWTAEPDLDRISRGGEWIHLRPQVMRVLVYLSERQGEVVHSEDLMHDLWSGKIVTDATLYNCVAELRNVLNEGSDGRDAIQTVPKKGYRLRLPVSGIGAPEPQGRLESSPRAALGYSRRSIWLSLVALALVASAGLMVGRQFSGPDEAVSGTEAGPPVHSIAVLPFNDLSPDGDQEYFSDGISEEILNLLAQIRSLKVIARTSSFSFKGKDVDIATMAEQMNVRHILEGSVRRSGDRVRITAQLIDAKDSSHLWSEAYDRDYSAGNLIEIQSEIARAITGRLRMTLTGDDEERLAKVPTENTEAYAAYLLGRERLKNRKVAELAVAVEQFSLAIELDPQFAGAYAGLADACGLYASYSGGQNEIYDFPRNDLCPSSLAGREQLARKALELDPESAESWVSLGTSIWTQAVRMHETEPRPKIHEKLNEAIAAFERGLELNPTLSDAYHGYGNNLMWYHVYPDMPFGWFKAWQAGRWESVFDKGLEVDPLSIPLHEDKSWYPITVRSKEEAKWHGNRMVEIAPDSPRGYATVGEHEWVLNGRIGESIPRTSKAMDIDPRRPEFPIFIGLAYSALGDPDMALAYLDLANTLTSLDAKRLQIRLRVEKAVVRIVSGRIDAHQVAELLPPSSQPLSTGRTAKDAMKLGVFADLATGRPEDALARLEVHSPGCIGAKDIPVNRVNCPPDLIRVYQELGDYKTEQAVSNAILRRQAVIHALFRRGQHIIERPVWGQMNRAGTLSAAGRTDAALDLLENLVSSGWRGDTYNKHLGFVLCCDVVFDAIRGHERFRAIAATIEADMAQQLKNVREMERRGEIPTLEEVKALIASVQEGG
jgi:TolB-like protein/DNA-binding winged helix-turn-helix (wHTH) protein